MITLAIQYAHTHEIGHNFKIRPLFYDLTVNFFQIRYDDFFEESETGAPADLVKLLQEQDSAEKEEYINLLKLQLEGTDEITTSEAKIAFMSIDPGITVEVINAYLSVS